MSAVDTVRLAMPSESVDLARIQRRAWSESGALAAAVAGMGADEATRAWHDAIVRPPLAHFRVLVAIGEPGVVAFAVTGPSPPPHMVSFSLTYTGAKRFIKPTQTPRPLSREAS